MNTILQSLKKTGGLFRTSEYCAETGETYRRVQRQIEILKDQGILEELQRRGHLRKFEIHEEPATKKQLHLLSSLAHELGEPRPDVLTAFGAARKINLLRKRISEKTEVAHKPPPPVREEGAVSTSDFAKEALALFEKKP